MCKNNNLFLISTAFYFCPKYLKVLMISLFSLLCGKNCPTKLCIIMYNWSWHHRAGLLSGEFDLVSNQLLLCLLRAHTHARTHRCLHTSMTLTTNTYSAPLT